MLDKEALKRDLKSILIQSNFGNKKDKEKAENEYRDFRMYMIETIGATPEEFDRVEKIAKAEFEVFAFEIYEVITKMAKVRDSFVEQGNMKSWESIKEALIAQIENAHELKLPVEKAESSDDKTLLNTCEHLAKAFIEILEYQKQGGKNANNVSRD